MTLELILLVNAVTLLTLKPGLTLFRLGPPQKLRIRPSCRVCGLTAAP